MSAPKGHDRGNTVFFRGCPCTVMSAPFLLYGGWFQQVSRDHDLAELVVAAPCPGCGLPSSGSPSTNLCPRCLGRR